MAAKKEVKTLGRAAATKMANLRELVELQESLLEALVQKAMPGLRSKARRMFNEAIETFVDAPAAENKIASVIDRAMAGEGARRIVDRVVHSCVERATTRIRQDRIIENLVQKVASDEVVRRIDSTESSVVHKLCISSNFCAYVERTIRDEVRTVMASQMATAMKGEPGQ